MKKYWKISVAAVLSIMLVFCTSSTVMAQSKPSAKDEVVYANLHHDGTVDTVYAVNGLESDGSGTMTDYGSYSEVNNMTTEDALNVSGDLVTINTKAEKLYYEGTLSNTQLPWNIAIHYFIGGKEISADEIAGKSGALEIKVDITQNGAANASFYNDYALQVTLTLDTGKCKNITATDSTLVNVGADKQIIYTALPGKGAHFTVKSDVTGFEMDGISINGLRLVLPVDVDDSEITDKVSELQDAIAAVDNGAGQLSDGAGDVSKGTDALSDGASQLSSGAQVLASSVDSLDAGVSKLQNGLSQLDNGVSKLKAGADSLQSGMNDLGSKSSELTGASSQIRAALKQISTALDTFSTTSSSMDELVNGSASVKAGLANLVSGIQSLQQAFDLYHAGLSSKGISAGELETKNAEAVNNINNTVIPAMQALGADASLITAMHNIAALLNADSGLIDADASFITQLDNGIDALYGTKADPGAAYLLEQYQKLDLAIQDLPAQLNKMTSGLASLKTAITTMQTQFSKFDSGLNAYTGGYTQILDGYRQLSAAIQTTLNGSNSLVDGIKTLKTGADALTDGADTLSGKTGKLASGADQLDKGANQLSSGSKELSGGTSELRGETSNMDEQITDQINGITDSISGGSYMAVSFVSDKNTNVKSVQFVLKTGSIEIKKAETGETQAAPQLSFWQKLLDLLGL